MAVELVRIETSDRLTLDGVLHNPSQARSLDTAVVYLHGKGGAFYTGPGRYIPESEEMANVPSAHLAINMRMHDLAFSRHSAGRSDLTNAPPFPVSAGGGMWECISDGVRDVGAAVAWLRTGGFQRIFVFGKSSGGFFATQYALTDDLLAGVGMFSPVHTHRMPFPTWFASDAERDDVVSRARDLVRDGKGYSLIPLPEWYYAISAASLVERADEPADIWENWMPSISAPLLMVYGSAEVPDVTIWDRGYASSPSVQRRRVILPDSDHSYIGSEKLVCGAAASFVNDIVSGQGDWD